MPSSYKQAIRGFAMTHRSLVACAGLALACPAHADDTPPSATGDDLLLVADIPMVYSASRRAQRIDQLSVPVSVVSNDDIRYRGVNSIPELLTMVPGVDVLRIDRNRHALGVRGLHHEFGDRTLVLINGRNAASVIVGGPDFGAMPVLVGDIERIEVVRGPGGAVWGANALNGVVNIITRKPEDSHGIAASTTLNEFGDTYSQVRVGRKGENAAFRFSFGYEDFESSDDAIANDTITARDFARTYRLDAEGVYGLNSDTKLRAGVAFAHTERGDFEFAQYWPMQDEVNDHVRLFARLERDFGEGTSAYVQWFGNFADEMRPSLFTATSMEQDIEGQITFDAGGGHTLGIGANVRMIHIDQTVLSAEDIIFPGGPFRESWFGGYVMDRWQVTERFALEGQVRGDVYSETTADWSARAAGIYSLDADADHTLRVSAAKAFRAPLLVLRRLTTQRLLVTAPPAPPIYGVNLVQPGDLDHERVYSLEAGYTGKLTDQLTLGVNTYYQRYTDLIGVRTLMAMPFVGDLTNIDDANAYGAEVELAWTLDKARLYAWYAYNAFDPVQFEQDTRSFRPAEHKIGLGARWHVTQDMTVNADYRYTSHTEGASADPRVSDTHRFDLALTHALFQGRGEVQIGVADLFDDTSNEVVTTGWLAPHETPGRSLFATVRIAF
jgi:outer membrane receptor for ferrienterochelin and colicin